jgi:DNA-binding NarL/FixJ family response regulator
MHPSAGNADPVAGVKQVVRLEVQSETGPALAEEVLERLVRAGRFRDEETAEHVERMSRSCALIACELGWGAAECNDLRTASAMHDIGKVGVPDAVLRDPGELTAEERALIEAHAEIGHEILSGSDDPVLQLAATVALTHHERFDGGGYPHGLEGEKIPVAGRIAAVADVFDALVHDRVYRSAIPMGEAADLIREGAGTQFDPEVVAAFEAVLPEIEAVLALYPDPDTAAARSGSLFAAPVRPIRVLVVSDHGAIARGLELLLAKEGVAIAARAGSVAEAEDVLGSWPVDVAVLDSDIDREGARRVATIAKTGGAGVLLYTNDPGDVAQIGAVDGTAARHGTPAEFVAAVRAVARGDEHMDPRISAIEPESSATALTAREREIVRLLASGLSGVEVGERLFLSSETVRTHIRNAMQRLGVKTRTHLVARAITSGEIPPSPPSNDD